MKTGKKVLSLVLVLIMCFGLVSRVDLGLKANAVCDDDYCINGLRYYESYGVDGEAECAGLCYKCGITGTIAVADKVSLPSWDDAGNKYYSNYTVTKISHQAFAYDDNIKKIVLPDSINEIEYAAFADCLDLEELNLPKNLTTVGDNAFRGIELKSLIIELKEIPFVLPQTETIIITENLEVDSGYVSSCLTLQNIIVHDDNPYFASEDGVLFNKDKTAIICYPAGKTETEYSIPNSVETICECAFCFNGSLIKINLPANLKVIEQGAFTLLKVEEISIPNSVEKIAKEAFFYNLNLTDVYFGGTEYEWTKVEDVKDASFNPAVTMHFKEEIVDPVPPEEPEEPDVPDVPITPIEPEEPKPEDHEHFYDDDEDETCNICGYDRTENCDCRCHNDNFFAKIIWSITNFFNKIFKKNKICDCGIAHY